MDGSAKFHLGNSDAVAWLRTMASESIDLVVTDPPYESLEKHRAIGTTTRLKHSKASSNDWFAIFPNDRFHELFVEVYRVLRKNTHFYLYCDPETMFVAKPIAEQVGFKFWKPIIWDKCLGPDTLVWTERGVARIADVQVGDRVASPEGGTTAVRATRSTRAPALKLELSDGTELIASREHRFVRADGKMLEAQQLAIGDALCTRAVRERSIDTLSLDDVIPDDDAVYELPQVTSCLWCGEAFETPRAASAHQARWCEAPMSKQQMAEQLGIAPKRLRRWMLEGRIPRMWARALGLEAKLGSRVQCYLQNDTELWYPRALQLDHAFGKFIGLFAAEGSCGPSSVSFALHAHEKHLHASIARFVRSLGLRAQIRIDGNCAVVEVCSKLVRHIVKHFVQGDDALTKHFTPIVYAAPAAFRQGIVEGLLEGDGHWSNEEQRQTYVSASPDLAAFVRRELEVADRSPHMHRFENEHAGGWRVRFDPVKRADATVVVAIEDIGMQDLVDISVEASDELFLLANGVVTHNCKIGMGYHYRARYECILFFEKGKRKLNDLGIADIIEAPRISGGYPAEKPTEVSKILIEQSTEPGQLVLDPFMGSASVGVAAVTAGRMFLGNDLCREAVEVASERLRETGAVAVATPEGLVGTARAPEAGQLGLTV